MLRPGVGGGGGGYVSQVFFNPINNNAYHLINYLTCSFIISPDFQDSL